MQSYKQSDDSIHTVLADTVKGGDLVKVGDLYGVAVTDGDGANLKTVATEGVFLLPKTATSTVIAQGVKVYTAAGKVNVTNTDDFLGYAWKGSGATEANVEVAINLR